MPHAARTGFSNASSFHTESSEDETQRLRAHLSARLLNRGVLVHSQDSIEGLAALIEAYENFEIAVEARGGQLTIEPLPAAATARTSYSPFALPRRTPHETAHTYASRIDAAATQLRV